MHRQSDVMGFTDQKKMSVDSSLAVDGRDVTYHT